MPKKEIYKFTAVQLVCLIGLYFVKSTAIGISFPVFIGLLPVVRHLISKCNFVEEKYCALLDPEELHLVVATRPTRIVILDRVMFRKVALALALMQKE